MLEKPITELVPWLFPITPEIVVCKDSGLLASFEFEGIDGDATTSQDVAIQLDRLDTAMRFVSDRPVTIWWTVRRARTNHYPEGSFSDNIGRDLDENHKMRFLAGKNYVNRHYLSILLAPEQGASRYFDRMQALIKEGESPISAMVTAARTLFSDQYAFAWEAREIDYTVARYEEVLEAVASTLRDISMRRLRGTELLGFLRSTITPDLPDRPCSWDENRFLDGLLPSSAISVGEDVLRIGDAYASALSMKSWPESTWSGAMDMLLSTPGEMVMSHCYRIAGRVELQKRVSSVKRYNELLKYPLKSYIIGAFRGGQMNDSSMNRARAEAVEDAQEVEREMTAGRLFWGWHNVTCVFFGQTPDEARNLSREALSVMHNSALPGAVRETLHLLSAFATTMPGQYRECQRWSLLSCQNMGDVAPIRSVLKGEESNEYLSKQTGRECSALTVLTTDYLTPFYFNFHSGALGHAMVVGPSRSGKSVFINFLLSQWRKYEPCRVIIFDKDFSCKAPTLLQGGQHINMSDTSESVRLNPISLVGDKAHWPFVVDWVCGLLSSRGYVVTAQDEKSVWEAIEEVANDPYEPHRRLLSVFTQLPMHLQVQLDPWVGDKPLAKYFDNVEDSFSISDFCCIEMGEVLRNPRLARAFMQYAFYRIQRMLEENRQGKVVPTIVYLEECWFLLEDETFAAKIRDMLKTYAKLTANVVMATQSLEDLAAAGGKVFSSIRDNIPTRIFLPNPYAGSESLRKLYRSEFELTDDQIDRIRAARPRENYFIVKPGVARMATCAFSKEQVAVLRSDAAALSLFEKHLASQSPDWKSRYLEEVRHV